MQINPNLTGLALWTSSFETEYFLWLVIGNPAESLIKLCFVMHFLRLDWEFESLFTKDKTTGKLLLSKTFIFRNRDVCSSVGRMVS